MNISSKQRQKPPWQPNGIHVEGEVFKSDGLRDSSHSDAAVANQVKLTVAYNPILRSEILLFMTERAEHIKTLAFNIDPEVYRLKVWFLKADIRGWQISSLLGRAGAFNGTQKAPQTITIRAPNHYERA